MKIVIFGNGFFVLKIIDSLLNSGIHVLSLIQDKVLSIPEQCELLFELNNRGVLLNDDLVNTSDLVLVFNYNKIIDLSKYSNIRFVNIHMGLLPKWRGNSANSWAVLNGENYVGYTIHLVNEILDSGEIIFQNKFQVDLNSNYSDIKEKILDDIKLTTPKILINYFNNQIEIVNQDNSEFVYCSKIRKSDGIIKNWSLTSEYLLRLHYLFYRNNKSISFYFKGNLFEIGKVKILSNFSKSSGVPGGVVYMKLDSIWVKTIDTAVEFSSLRINNQAIEISDYFKIGNRIGEDLK